MLTALAPPQLNLAPTLALHQQLVDRFEARKCDFQSALHRMQAKLNHEQIRFGSTREMPVALSALHLGVGDVEELRRSSELLHDLVETVLTWVVKGNGRLQRFFPHHARLFPYLCKTRGCDNFQIASRYDAIVTPDGGVRFIELNTACPAGFLHSSSVAHSTQEELGQLLPASNIDAAAFATINETALLDALLSLEEQAGVPPGLVGVLVDENKIVHELNLLIEAIKRRGRNAALLDARDLVYKNGQLISRLGAVTATYNKFRVSVPGSKNHCWRDGFESRYADLLASMRQQAVVSVNNLYGLSVAEDKGLLGLLFEPEVNQLFSSSEREFIQQSVAWTTRLEDKRVMWQGKVIDLLPFVAEHPELFVIKPANEGRGFGVVVGCDASPSDWAQLCLPDPTTPRVVQQFIEPVKLPVVLPAAQGFAAHEVEQLPMYLTLGLAMVCGKYEGLLSRISPSRVTNVARRGVVQAAFCTSLD